ncbi:MAG: tetratricopeptide repeat protein [Treponema sp.]|nr:tetratricopeptide repeat protein [Treponema sp.]
MKQTIFSVTLLACISFFSCSKPGDATVQRAMKLYQAGDYENAINLFNQSLTEDSSYSEELIYSFIANVYLQEDDFENALVFQEKSTSLRPEYHNLISLGMTYHMLKEDGKAEECYKKALTLNPKGAEAPASLGALYLGKNKFAEAVDYLSQAAEKDGKIAVIHANLGIAYAALGRESESEEEFEKAEKLKCKNLDDFREKAEELSKNGIR